MSSAVPSAVEAPTPGFEQRVSLRAIQINLPSKEFRLKCTTSFTIRGTTNREPFYANTSGVFRWELKSAREIPVGEPLKIALKKRKKRLSTKQDGIVDLSLLYKDIMEHVLSGQTEYKHHHANGEITVVFELNQNHNFQAETVQEAVVIAGQRRSVLHRLGSSANILKDALKVGKAVEDLHPAIKIVLSSVSTVFEFLEKQDVENKDVLDLITDIADFVDYTFDVGQFATIVQLKTVIEEMRALIQDAVELVVERGSRSNAKGIRSALLSTDRDKIDALKLKFARFKGRFDRGVLVENAIHVRNVMDGLDKLASSQENDTHLAKLDPHHQTRALRCLEGTREDIFKDVFQWANDYEAPNILWIHAYPGAGKSTIAMTLADQLRKLYRLGAIFAFDRKLATSPSALWRAISYKLASEYPLCREIIVSKLKESHEIALDNATASDIFRHLVAEPLQRWGESLSSIPGDRLPVIVIDGLDECGSLNGLSAADRRGVLSNIAAWSKLASEFKLVITGRAEDDIRLAFSEIPHRAIVIRTGNAVNHESSRDIQRYFEHELKAIAKKYRKDTNWPGKDAVEDLTKRAAGIFIWAATALQYIEESTPNRRLEQVQSSSLPAGDVYGLYRAILETSFSSQDSYLLKSFRDLIGAVVASQMSLTPADFGHLLDMDHDTVHTICMGLQSVLEGGGSLKFAHQSFVDFLLNRENQSASHSQEDNSTCLEGFCIDVAASHGVLAKSSFRLMNEKLHFNICNLQSSFLPNDALPRSHFQNAIGAPLAYACQFWGFHLEHTRYETSMKLLSPIATFMKEKLLFWFEALSGLQALNMASPALASLNRWLPDKPSKMNLDVDEIKGLVQDAIAFIRNFSPAMVRSAPHVYISALPFAPTCSTVAQCYAQKFKKTLSVLLGKLGDWPAGQMIIRGHRDVVNSVALSPDGKCVVSGSFDDTVRIWDVETGQTVAGPFEGHKGSVRSVAFSPDGKCVVSGSDDKTIRIWDTETGQTVAGPFEGHEDSVNSVAFSPDGKRVVSGSFDNTVRIWDVETGQTVVRPFEGHEDSVGSVAFSPDGKRVVSGLYDKTIRIWDSETGQMAAGPFEGHEHWVYSVAFSPDGKHIVSGSHDKTIRIWDAETGQTVAGPLKGHEDSVRSVAFLPDGKRVISGSQDMTIRTWDAETGQTVGGPFKGHKELVTSIAFSPDGKRVVSSGSYGNTVRISDAVTGQTVGGPLKGHEDSVTSVAFSPDGNRVVSASYDKTIRIWDVETGQTVAGPLKGHEELVTSVAFSPDGKRVVSGSDDKTIRIWDAETGQTVAGPFEGHEGSVSSVAFSPDGKRVVSGSRDKTIRICDVETGKTVKSYRTTFTDQSVMDSDGWVVAKGRELLFWVPPLHRQSLHRPSTVLVMGPNETQVDFSNAACGTHWTDCYTPLAG